MDGTYRSKTGMGLGIIGSKRLMDDFSVETSAKGTTVRLEKFFPQRVQKPTPKRLAEISQSLVSSAQISPLEELRSQNQEILNSLTELQTKQAELESLNSELEETNRGVVALYSELDEKSRFLQKASEVKTRFLSNMSHEFRTPVISILALTRLLLGKSDGELTQEQERQANYILKAAENLQEMVNDLLDLAKVEAGKITVRPNWLTVAELFGALRGMLRPLLSPESKVNLVFEDPGDLPEIYSDEGKIAQILRNFISNALKYTKEGEIRVSATLVGNDALKFSVKDTGIGIEEKHFDLIFEEFCQIEGVHQTKVKGTGLGLPLCKKFAQVLGGDVEVKSELGLGSEFSFKLPLNYFAVREEEANCQDKERGMPLLVIDDDEISRYLMTNLLKKPGIERWKLPVGWKG